ncbi:unnamed protein product [Pseudo-nitzschia multistriata]|uniref:tRNA(Phe) 7-[(3-amino-3-carboxypropyl)-4-demethylwyosine(37)-N(4)]-methyltransferase n=1 Tax=Pseudo-nitzschia multistriata TaxID=183589 RepID=A0A448ZCA3_9STRA|nr:unnamed protein product [Pseudo-nitzschia multistriata]
MEPRTNGTASGGSTGGTREDTSFEHAGHGTESGTAENTSDDHDGVSVSVALAVAPSPAAASLQRTPAPDSCAEKFEGNLPLHWLQPRKESGGDALPSFRDLRLKTHRTLYGTEHGGGGGLLLPPNRDKSPKGSVDAPIRHLVDLINSHSRFCTLSSCSGRLSLFDPSGECGNNNNNHSNDTPADSGGDAHQFTEASGKGRGRWVLVSHDPMDPEALARALARSGGRDTEEGSTDATPLRPWTFRFEPLLLHVAAASLDDGRELLAIALNLGFRESGLVVTDKRVTVAIRSHSLATAVPLVPNSHSHSHSDSDLPHPHDAGRGSLCAPASFLRALVHDANQRLEANWKQLDRLYRSIESNLFEVRSSPPPIAIRSIHHGQPERPFVVPPLNLWNASVIATTASEKISGSDTITQQKIWIAGGYGCGPATSIDANNGKPHSTGNNSTTARRSSKIYELEREFPDGSWQNDCWKEYGRPLLGETSETTGDGSNAEGFLEVHRETHRSKTRADAQALLRLGVRWLPAAPDLQGMASCTLGESNLCVVWGGRRGPTRPAGADLCVFDPVGVRFGSVADVRGDPPEPRWGHRLVALGKGDRAVLLGGCNHQHGAFDEVFVLHLVSEGGDGGPGGSAPGYFYWERSPVRLRAPRFHFGAALVQRDTVLVLGGLESTKDLLRPFEDESGCSPLPNEWACRYGDSKTKRSGTENDRRTTIATEAVGVAVDAPERLLQGGGGGGGGGSFGSFFGMACCTLISNNLLLVTGGIRAADTEGAMPSIQAFWISSGCGSPGKHRLRMRRIEVSLGPGTAQGEGPRPAALDFGSMVHHCCVALSNNEVLLVGGGVPSFAFGECYARSHHLLVDTDNADSAGLGSGERPGTSGRTKSPPKQGTPTSVGGSSPNEHSGSKASSSFATEAKQRTGVVYVLPRDARKAKHVLQQSGCLDRRFRMRKVVEAVAGTVESTEPPGTSTGERGSGEENQPATTPAGGTSVAFSIAIPVSGSPAEALALLDGLALRHGEEELPFSTSQYASKPKQRKT